MCTTSLASAQLNFIEYQKGLACYYAGPFYLYLVNHQAYSIPFLAFITVISAKADWCTTEDLLPNSRLDTHD